MANKLSEKLGLANQPAKLVNKQLSKLIIPFFVLVLVAMFGAGCFQDLITPAYISPQVLEYMDEEETGGKSINPLYTMLEEEQVKDAHKEGLNVFPWTVNNKDSMSELLEIGVDGIITDFPDICGEVIMQFYHRHRLQE